MQSGALCKICRWADGSVLDAVALFVNKRDLSAVSKCARLADDPPLSHSLLNSFVPFLSLVIPASSS